MRAGVDIGGTFTDVVRWHEGRLTLHKRLSTPDDPARAMLAGLEVIAERLDALTHVAHGSTVATNAILERKGASLAFITTQGLRDLLFIGRQERPQLYALHPTLPAPLVARDLCYDVPERLDHRGNVLMPLDRRALDAVLDEIARRDVEAVAVCLLYSYLNPDHEEAIRERIVQRGLFEAWQVVLS
ncbi:hydantoinase/oxoprolinase family protein, partial [bacterium]|nr:hydantoinase/oxoprolinase family protein [bacterium]